jgi:hypothetical protein
VPAGSNNALGPLYFATFCALSVTLGALLYNLTNVLNEYFTLQQQLTKKQEVSTRGRMTAAAAPVSLRRDAPAQQSPGHLRGCAPTHPGQQPSLITHALRCAVPR